MADNIRNPKYGPILQYERFGQVLYPKYILKGSASASIFQRLC